MNIDNVNEELQMEVIELQCNSVLKTKYHDVGTLEFYKTSAGAALDTETAAQRFPRVWKHLCL